MIAIETDCILLANLLIANNETYRRASIYEIMVRYSQEDNEHRVYFQAIVDNYHYMIDFYIKNKEMHSYKCNKHKQKYPFEYKYHKFI